MENVEKWCFKAGIVTCSLIMLLLVFYAVEYQPSKTVLLSGIFAYGLYWYSKSEKTIPLTQVVFWAIIVRLLWATFAEVLPVWDFKGFYDQSQAFFNGNSGVLFNTKSLMTIAIYGGAFKILNPSIYVVYLVGAILYATQIIYLSKSLSLLDISPSIKKVVVLFYAFFPSLVIFSSVLSSEGVFLTLSFIAVYHLIKYVQYGRIRDVVLLGVVIALTFYTRSLGALLFICIAGGLFFVKGPKSILFLALGFFSVLMSYGAAKLIYTDDFSFGTHPRGAFVLMTGTNVDSLGQFSKKDWALAGYGKVPDEEANAIAKKVAIERISADPIAFLEFAVSDKLRMLWRRDNGAWEKSYGGSQIQKELNKSLLTGLIKHISNAVYFLLLVIFLFCLFKVLIMRIKLTEFSKASGSLLLITSAFMISGIVLHIFIEVQERYHYPYVPFLVLFCAIVLNNNNKRRETSL